MGTTFTSVGESWATMLAELDLSVFTATSILQYTYNGPTIVVRSMEIPSDEEGEPDEIYATCDITTAAAGASGSCTNTGIQAFPITWQNELDVSVSTWSESVPSATTSSQDQESLISTTSTPISGQSPNPGSSTAGPLTSTTAATDRPTSYNPATTVYEPVPYDPCSEGLCSSGTSLSSGAIAGIAIGSAVLALILCTAAFLISRHRRSKAGLAAQEVQETSETSPPSYHTDTSEIKNVGELDVSPKAQSELPSIQVSTVAEPATNALVSPLSSTNLKADHRPWSPESFSSALSRPISPLGMCSELEPGVHQVHELDGAVESKDSAGGFKDESRCA